MKILFLGDVVGRCGREVILKHLPDLRRDWHVDFVIINADNAASGFGVTPGICKDFFDAGADVITGGDHVWDQQKDIKSYLDSEKRLLRPDNFPPQLPGTGQGIFSTTSGKKIMVIHVLGQVFHNVNLDCPFAAVDKALEPVSLGNTVDAIIVDVHAEATSEKMAMGQYLNGRVSMVVGSHTHVPTADARVLSKGTAYQTDAGMCGDYDSVIGFKPDAPLHRFLTKIGKAKLEVANGDAVICGTLVELDDQTGFALSCKSIQHPNSL